VPKPRELPGIDSPVRVGGNEGVGEIVELGSGDAAGLKVGDWVTFGRPQMGTWCSRMVAPTADLIPVPADARAKLDEVMGECRCVDVSGGS
jgi:trans-2-enoyl-CoA reductase